MSLHLLTLVDMFIVGGSIYDNKPMNYEIEIDRWYAKSTKPSITVYTMYAIHTNI